MGGVTGQGNVLKVPPFTLRVGVRSSDVVPAKGVSTTVTVALPATATLPMGQTTVALTGGGHVPPGEEVAELKVTPVAGNAPLKTTFEAGSGPLFTKLNVMVT